MSLGPPKTEPIEAPCAPDRNGPPCARCSTRTATERAWRDEAFGHPLCPACWRDYCDADRPKRSGLVEHMRLQPGELSALLEQENAAHAAWFDAWLTRRDA